MAGGGFEFGPSAPGCLLLTFALYLPLYPRASHSARGKVTAGHGTVTGVQAFTVSVVETHRQSEHSKIGGDKGKRPEEEIPGVLGEVISVLDHKRKRDGRGGFGHKGRSRWPPSVLSAVLGQW